MIKHILFGLFALFLFIGCSGKSEKKGTVMQIVKIKTELTEAEFFEAAKKREPRFKAIDGIVQKYYFKLDEPGAYGGVYIWDSRESLKAFKETELAKTIGEAYKVIEKPSVEIVDIMFQLREGK